MSAHPFDGASDSETRNAERTFSVKLGVAGSGAVVFTGTLEDCLYANRRRDGQCRVWRNADGVAMTLPKLPGKLAVRLAEFHDVEAA